jgi:hypothetical protein
MHAQYFRTDKRRKSNFSRSFEIGNMSLYELYISQKASLRCINPKLRAEDNRIIIEMFEFSHSRAFSSHAECM